MKTLLTLLFTLAFTAAAHAAQYADITMDQLKSAMADKKVVILDANGTKSWQEGHIPGAIDFQGVKGDLASALPKDKGALVVAYCVCVGCPNYLKAADAATKLGYTNVKHFPLGIWGWRDSGAKVEKGG